MDGGRRRRVAAAAVRRDDSLVRQGLFCSVAAGLRHARATAALAGYGLLKRGAGWAPSRGGARDWKNKKSVPCVWGVTVVEKRKEEKRKEKKGIGDRGRYCTVRYLMGEAGGNCCAPFACVRYTVKLQYTTLRVRYSVRGCLWCVAYDDETKSVRYDTVDGMWTDGWGKRGAAGRHARADTT